VKVNNRASPQVDVEAVLGMSWVIPFRQQNVKSAGERSLAVKDKRATIWLGREAEDSARANASLASKYPVLWDYGVDRAGTV